MIKALEDNYQRTILGIYKPHFFRDHNWTKIFIFFSPFLYLFHLVLDPDDDDDGSFQNIKASKKVTLIEKNLTDIWILNLQNLIIVWS